MKNKKEIISIGAVVAVVVGLFGITYGMCNRTDDMSRERTNTLKKRVDINQYEIVDIKVKNASIDAQVLQRLSGIEKSLDELKMEIRENNRLAGMGLVSESESR